MSVKLPRIHYPASNVSVAFNAVTQPPSLEMFEEAFGTSDHMKLELVDGKTKLTAADIAFVEYYPVTLWIVLHRYRL